MGKQFTVELEKTDTECTGAHCYCRFVIKIDNIEVAALLDAKTLKAQEKAYQYSNIVRAPEPQLTKEHLYSLAPTHKPLGLRKELVTVDTPKENL